MADYNITQTDINLLKCHKLIHIRVYLLNSQNMIIDELQGYVTSGDGNEDATSDVRRTCNYTIHSYDCTYDIGEYNRFWLNNRVRIDLGFEYFDRIYWYKKGIYLFTSCSYAYDGATRDISFQCSDLVTTLDGTFSGIIVGECPYCNKPLQECEEHRGLFFGETILIEGCKKIEEGEFEGLYEGNDIRKVVIDLLEQYGIKEHRIETIGQVSCLQGYAVNWKQNRMDTGTLPEEVNRDNPDMLYDDDGNTLDHGTWHMIPYDLEFEKGTTLWEVLVKIRDLYPGYEMFFDKDGVFVFQLIPICHHNLDVMDYRQMECLIISENCDYDLTGVRNATKVYGQAIETDRFSDKSEFLDSEYIKESIDENGKVEITITTTVLLIKPEFEIPFAYKGDIVLGITFPSELGELLKSIENAPKDLNGDVMGEDAINASGKLAKSAYITINDKTYPLVERHAKVIKYENFSIHKNYEIDECCLYNEVVYKFLANKSAGEWNVDVVEKLAASSTESNASNLIEYLPMEYKRFNSDDMFCFKFLENQNLWVFAGMYQIEGYHENNNINSPFAIDKIGYRLQVLSGGEYDDIMTSTLAKERAEYETWLKSRLIDTLTLETIIIPFLEVNQKIQYKKASNGSVDSYIIKSLSYSFMDGTMTITMNKFYELDPFIVCS